MSNFPGNSAGKETTCNAGDPSLIAGSGRAPGQGIGYPSQYCWASLMAQMVKNLPSMREIWVRPLGWEDPLEEGMATHSSIIAWRTPWTGEPGRPHHRVTKSWTRLTDFHFSSYLLKNYQKKREIIKRKE